MHAAQATTHQPTVAMQRTPIVVNLARNCRPSQYEKVIHGLHSLSIVFSSPHTNVARGAIEDETSVRGSTHTRMHNSLYSRFTTRYRYPNHTPAVISNNLHSCNRHLQCSAVLTFSPFLKYTLTTPSTVTIVMIVT